VIFQELWASVIKEVKDLRGPYSQGVNKSKSQELHFIEFGNYKWKWYTLTNSSL